MTSLRSTIRIPAWLLAVSILFLLAACSERPQFDEINQKLAELRDKPRGQLDPVPEFPEPRIARYTHGQARDPFTPEQTSVAPVTARVSELTPDTQRRRHPLERWQLNELSLRGVMRRSGEVRALILTPDQELVSVQVGDYMGQNHGRIVTISSQSIRLVELVHDHQAGWQEREQELSFSSSR